MQRILILLILLQSTLLIITSFQLAAYQFQTPRLLWAIDTLSLDWKAEHKLLLACKA